MSSPISGHYHSLTIAQALGKISRNELALPLIQRNFVWDIDRVTKLFDSILQGYPINSMLFWEVPPQALESVQMYAFIRNFSHYGWYQGERGETENGERYFNKPLDRGKENLPENLMAVLDGQQRLTSLYMGLCGSYAEKEYWGRHGYAHNYPPQAMYLCVSDLAQAADTLENYRANRYQLAWRKGRWQDGALQVAPIIYQENNSELWLHLGEVMHGAELSAEAWTASMLLQLQDFAMQAGADLPEEDWIRVRETLQRLHYAIHTEPYISYYREKSTELARAVETFIRINNGGMSIGYAELLFSILSAQWKHLNAREEIESVEAALRSHDTGLNLEKGFVLKAALLMVEAKNMRFELGQFTSRRIQRMEEIWPQVKTALLAAARTIAHKPIVYLNTPALAMVVAYFYYRQGQAGQPTPKDEARDQARIHQWLLRAQLLWSGDRSATETKISRLTEIITQHFEQGHHDFPFAELVAKSWGVDMRLATEGSADGLILEDQLKRPKWEAATRFLLAQLQSNVQRGLSYDVDHCFPFHEAYNAEQHDAQHHAEIHEVPNLQLLPSSLNRSKNGLEFHLWYDGLAGLLEDEESRQALNVQTAAELHQAHFYPEHWLAYTEEDGYAEKVEKFRDFLKGRRTTALKRLREVFHDPA